MSDLIEIIRLAKESVTSFATQRAVQAEEPWDKLVLAGDTLAELVDQHVKAVGNVVAPIVDERDLGETARRYATLANNQDFPQGYDAIRGVLASTRDIRGLKDDRIQDKVRAVSEALYRFQSAVFTLAWDSYRVADAFEACANVAANLEASVEDVALAARPFQDTFTGLFNDIPHDVPATTPETVAELISLVRSWSRAWQRYVQESLYSGHGLNSAIAQLKMARYG